jgi:hypothetical protein
VRPFFMGRNTTNYLVHLVECTPLCRPSKHNGVAILGARRRKYFFFLYVPSGVGACGRAEIKFFHVGIIRCSKTILCRAIDQWWGHVNMLSVGRFANGSDKWPAIDERPGLRNGVSHFIC